MDELTQSIVDALQRLRDRVVWRPGKAEEHVRRRIDYGHLPESATLDDYEAIIRSVVAKHDADVYAYRYGDAAYAVAVARIETNDWLVMVGLDGVMETAFVIEREAYTEGESWQHLGKLGVLEGR